MNEKTTGTCPTCGKKDLRVRKNGKVWNHRAATRDTASGRYGMNCSGGRPLAGKDGS